MGNLISRRTFFSVSQDIVIDTYRIDILDEDQQGAGAAMTQAGYRFGLLASGAGALYLASNVDGSIVYGIMAGPGFPPCPAGSPIRPIGWYFYHFHRCGRARSLDGALDDKTSAHVASSRPEAIVTRIAEVTNRSAGQRRVTHRTRLG